ncbi:MAG: NADPH-dependent glutamate synthase [Acidimicrobiia bacterium]|nr:MAG: NADPH-dependent glutamate synthase [Acidimicrobiia bacterium]
MTPMSTRERMKIPRQEMPLRDPKKRRRDFEEVALGLDPDVARLEAARCLVCRHPTCVDGCPVRVRIDRFLPLLAEGDLEGAARVVHEDNALAAVCGRVCPQESQCEGACVLSRKGVPVAIGALERFVADHGPRPEPGTAAATGRKVAVVGSGPSGLTCARDLARLGHSVTVFEALHRPGGVLAYGIPSFRLPGDVLDEEIAFLEALGIEFVTDAVIGPGETIDDLFVAGYDAMFLGVGAGLPRFPDLPGEDLVGVFSANEFLTRINLMGAGRPGAATPIPNMKGARVVVVGGGNTAVDAARTALRLGAAEVRILYRRDRPDMPARLEEVEHALEEGVLLEALVAPVDFVGDGGAVTGVRIVSMRPGDPDATGRRRPEPVAGSERQIAADLVVVAIGNDPNPLLLRTTSELDRTDRGTIVVDPATGSTSIPGVWAGGDVVTGGATVIQAMGAGRRAAAAIDAHLREEPVSNRAGANPAGLPITRRDSRSGPVTRNRLLPSRVESSPAREGTTA